MTSSGKKRGVAVAATTALALSGLAFTTTPAQADDIQGNDGNAVELYTPINGVSGQTANGKTTTTLAASAGDPAVNSFVFWFSLNGVQGDADDVEIADVANLNGWGTAQWTLPSNPTLGDIDFVYVVAEDNTDAPLSSDASGGIFDPTNASDHNAVNIDGDYLEPLGVWNNAATLTGMSSDNDPSDIDFDIAGPVSDEGDSNPIIAGPTTAAGTPFAANVTVGGNDTGDAYDEVVGRMSDFAEGSDAQVYSLYDQVVAGVDRSFDPAFPPNVGGLPAGEQTRWILTATDQNDKPITGVWIFESDAAGNNLLGPDGMGRTVANGDFNDAFTNELGQVTIRLNEDGATYGIDGAEDQNPTPGVGSTYVVIDKNDDGNFDNGVDEIVELTISELPQTPATIDIESSLGDVMDADEDPTFTFTVRDANGDPIQDATTNVKIARDVLDDDPADFVEDLGNTDTNGSGQFTDSSPLEIGVDDNPTTVTVTATSGPATGTFVIETDEASIAWDNAPSSQALANTDTTEFGTLQLPSGSVLPNRAVEIDLIQTADANGPAVPGATPGNAIMAPQSEQPAGTIRGGNLIADATTDVSGRFGVKIDDPAAPTGQELDDTLQGDTAFIGTVDLDLDWLRSLTPVRVNIFNSLTSNSDADGLDDFFAGGLRPGALGRGNVKAFNSDDVVLTNLDVQVTIDEGFFINPADPYEATPVPGAPVDFKSVGQSITVNTGGGAGPIWANIERHAGFDDDGLVLDELHASVAGVSDSHDMTWSTQNIPLNPRATDPLVVELSASQESSILPKARAGDPAGIGQLVDYDVMAFDQFGNPVSQDTDINDNTPLAGFTVPLGDDTNYALNQPVIRANADSATDQVLEVELDNAVKTVYVDNPLDGAFDETSLDTGVGSPLPIDIEQFTSPINWYDVNYDASTFTLGQQGPETVPVGTAVTEVLTAADQEGQPLENLPVDFLRGGPGSEDDDSCFEDLLNNCQATDGNGQAFYDFVGGSVGTATVSAVVYEPVVDGGTRIGTIGPDTVRFGQLAKINVKLSGKNAKNNKDKLKVNAESIAAGAKVRLQKKVDGVWKKVGTTKNLNAFGNKVFRVKDRNGNKVTKYRAKVSKTTTTRFAKSNVVKQK